MKRRHPLLITGLAGLVLLLLAGIVEFFRYTEGDVNELLHDPGYKNDQTGLPHRSLRGSGAFPGEAPARAYHSTHPASCGWERIWGLGPSSVLALTEMCFLEESG